MCENRETNQVETALMSVGREEQRLCQAWGQRGGEGRGALSRGNRAGPRSAGLEHAGTGSERLENTSRNTESN